MDYGEIVLNYLQTIDESLEILSHGQEHVISDLPSWVLHNREITIGVTDDNEGIVIKIIPKDELDEDIVNITNIATLEDANRIARPMKINPMPNRMPENDYLMVGDMSVVETHNPLAVPALDNRFMMGFGRVKPFVEQFSIEKAKEEAISLWNTCSQGLEKNKSYILEVRKIFEKFQAIIKRKAFVERRIHRYIDNNRDLFLPSHTKCLYEHPLYLNGEKRVADYIIEREQGLPPILIELESPVHTVVKSNNELTAQANHAKNQIVEWVKFIDRNAAQNASGEESFLSGPKEKLVVIGRGLEHEDVLIDMKFDNVAVWTYDMFLKEAKKRANNKISAQYRMLGLEPINPF